MAVEPRKPGRLKGRIRIGLDFDEPLPAEILAVFRGEEDVTRDPAFRACGIAIVST